MIQYPKNEHITLPSVEAGFGTLNILRDPPKAVWTRYKPSVFEDNKLTEWVDCSGDRICEMIKPYARGINPMVSVDYSNYGTNGGQMRESYGAFNPSITTGGGQSYYAYGVNRGGAFRPPIIPPQELLPLSRQPRLPKTQQTNPGSALITRDMDNLMKCTTDLRQVRQNLLKTYIAPRAIFNIETPASKLQEVNWSINDKKYSAVNTNIRDSKAYILGINDNPKYGIKDQKNVLYGSIPVNPYKNIQVKTLSEQAGNQPLPVRERVNTACNSNASGNQITNHMQTLVKLERNTPLASIQVNPSQRIDMNANISSRDFKLPPKRQLGGFQNSGFNPSGQRPDITVFQKAPSIYKQAAIMANSK